MPSYTIIGSSEYISCHKFVRSLTHLQLILFCFFLNFLLPSSLPSFQTYNLLLHLCALEGNSKVAETLLTVIENDKRCKSTVRQKNFVIRACAVDGEILKAFEHLLDLGTDANSISYQPISFGIAKHSNYSSFNWEHLCEMVDTVTKDGREEVFSKTFLLGVLSVMQKELGEHNLRRTLATKKKKYPIHARALEVLRLMEKLKMDQFGNGKWRTLKICASCNNFKVMMMLLDELANEDLLLIPQGLDHLKLVKEHLTEQGAEMELTVVEEGLFGNYEELYAQRVGAAELLKKKSTALFNSKRDLLLNKENGKKESTAKFDKKRSIWVHKESGKKEKKTRKEIESAK
jgi:hypothetical protein